jgi:hypothetical protein
MARAMASALRVKNTAYFDIAVDLLHERILGIAASPARQAAARLGQARLAAFCRRHAYRGGKPPAELLGRPGPGHHSATDTPSRSVESVTAPW